MCRHLAYTGPPATLEELVLAPPHSLLHQSYRPQEQRHGVVNADGFGVGWFDARRDEPAVYRSTRPVWADRSFASMAGVIDAATVVASVRSATPPSPTDDPSTQPFAADGWLFAHNGFIDDFRSERGVALRRSLSWQRESRIMSASDSEVLFAMVLDGLDRGAPPSEAVAEAVGKVRPGNGGALNVVLASAGHLVATRCGASLYTLRRGGAAQPGFVIASEPFDDDPGWTTVPDPAIVEVRSGTLTIRAF